MITVVVADDQPLVRAGIAMLLRAEQDVDVVAEVSDGDGAVIAARGHRPDVVLMDIRMPGVDGITATRLIVQERNATDRLTRVLVLTTFDDDDAVYGALRAGASGFLLKHAAPRDLAEAVRRVASGDAWLDPAIAGKVIAALAHLPPSSQTAAELLRDLTPRELEVLELIAHGLSNEEIMKRLVLAEATVKTHVSRILMKTGSHDRAKAVVLAYQSGLVVPPAP